MMRIVQFNGAQPVTLRSTDGTNSLGDLLTPMHIDPTGFGAKSTTFTYLLNGDIDKIETIIGTKKRVDTFAYTVQKDISSITTTIVDV